MREYFVPFSTREETPFIFGLTIREMLWIAGGFMVGLLFSMVLFVIIGANLQNIIICVPVLIPFVAGAFYLSKKRIEEDDSKETVEEHLIKQIRYKLRCRYYLNFRQVK